MEINHILPPLFRIQPFLIGKNQPKERFQPGGRRFHSLRRLLRGKIKKLCPKLLQFLFHLCPELLRPLPAERVYAVVPFRRKPAKGYGFKSLIIRLKPIRF